MLLEQPKARFVTMSKEYVTLARLDFRATLRQATGTVDPFPTGLIFAGLMFMITDQMRSCRQAHRPDTRHTLAAVRRSLYPATIDVC
jgi:hypothetical protein